MKQVKVVTKFPECDFCDKSASHAGLTHYGPARRGPWANMCDFHVKFWGLGLGQEIIVLKG